VSRSRKRPAEVPLARDEGWWLHPAFRGQQALPLAGSAAGALPHRWTRSDAPAVATEHGVDAGNVYSDLAKLLYSLNGHRPGPVRGFYVVVETDVGRFAVGQLCADPVTPVQLFEDLVYATEAEARNKAAALRAANAGARSLPVRETQRR
jgi:hypothetical protein